MAHHFATSRLRRRQGWGNSPDNFIGPETPGVPGNWDDKSGKFKPFRDGNNKILRQGARFRVFEYTEDANGALTSPREIVVGGDLVDIEWRVHLANRKASFFVFDGLNGSKDNFVARSKLSPTKEIKDDPSAPICATRTFPPANAPPSSRSIPASRSSVPATEPGGTEKSKYQRPHRLTRHLAGRRRRTPGRARRLWPVELHRRAAGRPRQRHAAASRSTNMPTTTPGSTTPATARWKAPGFKDGATDRRRSGLGYGRSAEIRPPASATSSRSTIRCGMSACGMSISRRRRHRRRCWIDCASKRSCGLPAAGNRWPDSSRPFC